MFPNILGWILYVPSIFVSRLNIFGISKTYAVANTEHFHFKCTLHTIKYSRPFYLPATANPLVYSIFWLSFCILLTCQFARVEILTYMYHGKGRKKYSKWHQRMMRAHRDLNVWVPIKIKLHWNTTMAIKVIILMTTMHQYLSMSVKLSKRKKKRLSQVNFYRLLSKKALQPIYICKKNRRLY